MTVPGGQGRAPAGGGASPVRQGFGAPAVAFSPLSWWFLTWRARVLDESTGNVEARLSVVADALGRLDQIGGVPGVHLLASSSLTFEFWYQAASAREAFGGARAALRQAFKTAGIGDPAPLPSGRGVDVMLMLEELPTLWQDDS